MVESIVKQRDMYRILLAQSTPLPEEAADTSQVRRREGGRGGRGGEGGGGMSENLKRYFICIFYFQLSTSQGAAGILVSPQKTTPTTSVALQELKEQFEAYRYSSLPSSPSLPLSSSLSTATILLSF